MLPNNNEAIRELMPIGTSIINIEIQSSMVICAQDERK